MAVDQQKKQTMISCPLIRVWPEWGSSGIWAIGAPLQPNAGSMIPHDYLALPQDLAARFDAWIEWLWDAMPDMPTAAAFDWKAFSATSLGLAQDLAQFLGPEVRVEYLCGKAPKVIQPGSPTDVETSG